MKRSTATSLRHPRPSKKPRPAPLAPHRARAARSAYVNALSAFLATSAR